MRGHHRLSSRAAPGDAAAHELTLPSGSRPEARTRRSGLLSSLRRAFSIGPLARSVAVVAGGTAIGQLIVIASSPFIARLYGPSDLGVLAVYGSIVAMSLPAALLRYDLAVQLPQSAREAARLVVAAIGIAVSSSALIGIALWFVRAQLTNALGVPQLAPYVLLVPVGILGAAIYMAITSWTVRTRRYRDLARTRVTQQIGLCATQIGFGLLRVGPIGLLVGDVIGRAGGIGALCRATRDHDRECFSGMSARRVFVTARRHSTFTLLASSASMLNAVGLFGPPVLFASLFGTVVAGQIALGQRVIALPITLAGQSVAQVYLAEVSRLAREMPQAVPALLRSTVRRLAVLAIVPSVILITAGPWLFAEVFGAQWRLAGTFARALALAFAAQMVAAPISQTLNVLGRSRLQLVWDFGRSLLVLGGIWCMWRAGRSPLAAVTAYSTAMTIAYAFMIGMAFVAARAAALGASTSPTSRE